MDFDNKLYGMTTLIKNNVKNKKSTGTGFFYNIISQKHAGGSHKELASTWLITNRHVALQKIGDNEVIPDKFIFHIRQIVNNIVDWAPIILEQNDFIRRMKLHNNPAIDVVAIDVGDLIAEYARNGAELINYSGLTNENLPIQLNSAIEVTDDVIIAGYPRSFYDKINKYPLVKSGIIASKWGANFQNKPVFLIDTNMLPGSSGGVVLSKPTNITVQDNKLQYNPIKQFVFLGIYSGEAVFTHKPTEFAEMLITKKDTCNVGYVWYSHLVPDIIENGISL